MTKRPVLTLIVLAGLIAATSLAPSAGMAQQVPAVPAVPGLAKLVDINKASIDDLKKVPGLDESLAKKVVGGRPFKSVDELLSKKILSKDVFDKVKPLLTASQ
jgi:DNA uptake protein ComE-like DNA-binding protein